jgi:hypothetical protein
MPVSSLTLWDVDPHKGRELVMRARDALKRSGATNVRIGHVHTGPFTGRFATSLTFDSWESYGHGNAKLTEDQEYRAILAEAHQASKTVYRTVLVWEEI